MKRERHQGHKPPVAFTNQAIAKANIIAKRDLIIKIVTRLEQVQPGTTIDSSQRRTFLAALPNSVAKFNHWSSESLEVELLGDGSPFRRNASATLRSCDLLPSVQAAISAVRACRLRPDPAVQHENMLTVLRRRLKMSEQLRAIAEESIRRTKSDYNALRKDYDALKLQLQAAHREAALLVTARRTAPAAAKENVSPFTPKKGGRQT